MGLYDRDYVRAGNDDGISFSQLSVNTWIIIICVAVWLIEVVANGGSGRPPLFDLLAGRPEDLWRPWMWWRFVTMAFVHDYETVAHILFNMFVLGMFGSYVEGALGSREYLRMYLIACIVSSVTGLATMLWQGIPAQTPCCGASGAISAVIVILAFMDPYRTIMFNFFIPIPMWLWAVIALAMDLFALQAPSEVAVGAHLGGMAFGALYYTQRWNFSQWIPALPTFKGWSKAGAKTLPQGWRVVAADDEVENLDAEVDRILAKISKSGESSLTDAERKTMERASRRYQKRRE